VERKGEKGGKSKARESRGSSATKVDRRMSKHQSHSRVQAVDGGSQSDGSSVTEDSDEERQSLSASGSELMRPSLPGAAMLMSGSDGIGMNVVCAPQVLSQSICRKAGDLLLGCFGHRDLLFSRHSCSIGASIA
jgi:hypothetical protein